MILRVGPPWLAARPLDLINPSSAPPDLTNLILKIEFKDLVMADWQLTKLTCFIDCKFLDMVLSLTALSV
jgi:hypothetical protein